jgi:hypothetical protein
MFWYKYRIKYVWLFNANNCKQFKCLSTAFWLVTLSGPLSLRNYPIRSPLRNDLSPKWSEVMLTV